MNKILILTTEGCEACNIAKTNVESAVTDFNKKVFIEIKDWHDIKLEFIKKEHISDFPTVIYMINEKIVHKSTGTYPSAVYYRWMDMYFKK